MSYNLFIDDMRNPVDSACVISGINLTKDWVVVRSTKKAMEYVDANGMPERLALDHDLGLNEDGTVDEVSTFITWLIHFVWDGRIESIPSWTIHSSNPEGCANMSSKLRSWRKSAYL